MRHGGGRSLISFLFFFLVLSSCSFFFFFFGVSRDGTYDRITNAIMETGSGVVSEDGSVVVKKTVRTLSVM